MAKIYYLGDSTAAFNGPETYPQTGMSQGLMALASTEVISLAKNGRSTKSFLDEGLFVPAQQAMLPGDLVLIQFGHNAEKDYPARHTDPDTGYKENLLYFIREAQSRGALPVLVTPIARRLFDEKGTFLPGSHGAYPEAVRQLGKAENVPVIDLTAVTEDFLARLGDEASKPLFMWPIDNTHLKPEGAAQMADFLATGLRRLGKPYSMFLK